MTPAYRICTLFICLIIFGGTSQTDDVAVADEATTVWGLRTGDRFVVSVLCVKQTDVKIDDQTPMISNTRDRYEIEYRVTQVRNSGDAIIAARLRKASREVGESSQESLKAASRSAKALEDLRIGFEIDPAGQILTITQRDRDTILNALSGLDLSTSQLLRQSCPEDVIAAWLSRPFWAGTGSTDQTLQQDGEKKEPSRSTVSRKDAIAVGPFGVLQANLEIQPKADAGEDELMEISGRGRFVPLVVSEREANLTKSTLQNVTAELVEYTGKILLARKPETIRPAPQENIEKPQPEVVQQKENVPFQSMEVNIRLHGRGTIKSAPTGNDQKVEFRQTQMQLWILSELTFARSEYLFDAPVPVPAAPRLRP